MNLTDQNIAPLATPSGEGSIKEVSPKTDPLKGPTNILVKSLWDWVEKERQEVKDEKAIKEWFIKKNEENVLHREAMYFEGDDKKYMLDIDKFIAKYVDLNINNSITTLSVTQNKFFSAVFKRSIAIIIQIPRLLGIFKGIENSENLEASLLLKTATYRITKTICKV